MAIRSSEYPAPILLEPLTLTKNADLTISAQFLPEGEPPEYALHCDPVWEGIIGKDDVGFLLIDVWSKSEPDKLMANLTFLTEDNLFAVRDAYVDQEWRNRGLISFMLCIAQNMSGWSRVITGLEWINVW